MKFIVGNHGMEWESPPQKARVFESRVKEWIGILTPVLDRLPGIEIENKVYSVSVHYRKSADPARVVRAMKSVVSSLEGASVIHGKKIWNLVPAGAPRKGWAFKEILKRLKIRRGLYIGDDQTDEDVFRIKSANHFFIRVGRSKKTAAKYYLKDQAAVSAFLQSAVTFC